jgi:hypothetical protein
MAFLSSQNEIRLRKIARATVPFLLKSNRGSFTLSPLIFGLAPWQLHGDLLVDHFKIFPACFGSLTAKTTSCFFEPSSAPV